MDNMTGTKNFSCCHANIRSVLAQSSDGISRADMLRNLCLYEYDVDVLALTETHLSSDIDNNILKIKGYEIFRNDRKINGRQGGGVLLYIRADLNPIEINDLSNPNL